MILELTSPNLGLQQKTLEILGLKVGLEDRGLLPQCLLQTLHTTKYRGMRNRIYGQLTLRVETKHPPLSDTYLVKGDAMRSSHPAHHLPFVRT